MIIDMHCHMALSARRVEESDGRFSFEPAGASARPGFDSYMSPRMQNSLLWRYLKLKLGISLRLPCGEKLDQAILSVSKRHLLDSPGIDRFVLLAFDEYHDDDGRPIGPIERRGKVGTDMYSSNSFVRDLCRAYPHKFLFGASIHPYRPAAIDALEEVSDAGAVLVKWLPVHQNISARDGRVEAFVARAGELGMPLLIHYGGEAALRSNHRAFEDPEPMFDLLERLKKRTPIPPVIIAHIATPSLPLQRADHFRTTADALLRRLKDDPVYADISAMTNKPWWLKHVLCRTELHSKLVYGSDFPIPPTTMWFPLRLFGKRRELLRNPSWAERSYRITKALGFPEEVFLRAGEVLHRRLR